MVLRQWLRLPFQALLILVPWALAFGVYAPRLGDYFALDDFIWLRAVQDRNAGSVLARAFTFPDFTPFEAPTPFWRPASDGFFYTEYLMFGLNPAPYHVVNVGLHALVATLGGVFVARVTRSTATGIAVGALFAVAPTYDFAVTWISQFSELLGATFSLIALLAYHLYLTNRDRPSPLLLVGALAALTMSLLCKESAIVTLVILPGLVFVTPREAGGRSMRAVFIDLVPVGLVAMTYGGFLFIAEYLDAASGDSYELGPHVADNTWAYLRRMTFPYATGELSWTDTAQTWTAVAYLALGAAALLARRALPSYFFVWSLIALLPFSLFRGGIEWRYTYLATLPCAAFLMTLALEVGRALPSSVRTPAELIAASVLAAAVAGASTETRGQQAWIAAQARDYQAMFVAVRQKCGELPPESHVYIVESPT